jgi:hypothetical protein
MKSLLSDVEMSAFVSASEPRILLQMPDCHEVCVNRAHQRTFGLALPVAETVQQFTEMIDEFVKEFTVSGTIHDERCYCHPEKANHIIALRSSECIFEQNFRKLRPYQTTFGLGFRFISQNGSREYNVLNVHSQRVDLDRLQFLLCTFLMISGLRVYATTEPDRRTTVGIKLDDIEWLPSATFSRESIKEYDVFNGLLDGSFALLDDNKYDSQAVSEKINNYLDVQGWDYSPARPLARSIFAWQRSGEGGSTSPISKTEMRNNVVQIQQRLYDAPAITSYAERLVSRLQNELKMLYKSFYLENLREMVPDLTPRSASAIDLKEDEFSQQLANYRINLYEFRKQLPNLLKEHKGQYVALVEGKIVGFDPSESALIDRITKSYPPEKTLVHPIWENYKRVIHEPGVRVPRRLSNK